MAKSQSARRGAARRSATRSSRQPRGEQARLLKLEELVSERVVGKEQAIARVANAIRIRRAKLDFRPERPDGAFLLVGPAGVGKTEFAVAFGAALLGTTEKILFLDMADYSEEEDLDGLRVNLLAGSPNVLVAGDLTTPVRRDPRTVILLRGLEHAHRNFYRILLHILERGRIEDAQGLVPFGETVIFATTRLHPDETELVEQIGFNRDSLEPLERSRRMLEEQFTPELVAAFQEVLHFEPLTPEVVRQIARLKVRRVIERLQSQHRGVQVNERVYDTFIREDEMRSQGARYLNRALEERLFTPLSKVLLAHGPAQRILVDVENGELTIRVGTPPKTPARGPRRGAKAPAKGKPKKTPRARTPRPTVRSRGSRGARS